MVVATLPRRHVTRSVPVFKPAHISESNKCPVCGSRLFVENEYQQNGRPYPILCCLSASHEFNARTGESIRKWGNW